MMKVKVDWDFGDTELEDVDYAEALKESGCPHIVTIPEQLVEEYKKEGFQVITDWLSDEYGYTHFGWEQLAGV